jgi:hypothetical protein
MPHRQGSDRIERSFYFYCNLLTMEQIGRFDESDEIVRSVVGLPRRVPEDGAPQGPGQRPLHRGDRVRRSVGYRGRPDADRENGPPASMPHLHRIVGGESV